jgi:PAS domain S-box-containing protein
VRKRPPKKISNESEPVSSIEQARSAVDYRLELMQGAGEGVPDAVFIVEPETGEILFANNHAEIMFGYLREKMEGQTIEMLIPSAKRESHLTDRGSYSRNPRPRSMGLRNVEGQDGKGRTFPAEVELVPRATSRGTVVYAYVRTRNVSK